MQPALHLSSDAINELKAIWRKETGETLSDVEVDRMGMRILEFFALLERPFCAQDWRFLPDSNVHPVDENAGPPLNEQ